MCNIFNYRKQSNYITLLSFRDLTQIVDKKLRPDYDVMMIEKCLPDHDMVSDD